MSFYHYSGGPGGGGGATPNDIADAGRELGSAAWHSLENVSMCQESQLAAANAAAPGAGAAAVAPHEVFSHGIGGAPDVSLNLDMPGTPGDMGAAGAEAGHSLLSKIAELVSQAGNPMAFLGMIFQFLQAIFTQAMTQMAQFLQPAFLDQAAAAARSSTLALTDPWRRLAGGT